MTGSSSFRDKYLKKEQQPTEATDNPEDLARSLIETLEQLKGSDVSTFPPPRFGMRQEILKRMFLLGKMDPKHAPFFLTGCINTIAAIFGDDVAAQASAGIGGMLSEAIGQTIGTYSNPAYEDNNGQLVIKQEEATMPPEWFDNNGNTYTKDLSPMLAKAATKKMMMN